MTDRPIYLDYQATTPVDARVAQAMLRYLTAEFGNPSSGHAYGRAAAAAVQGARDQLSRLIGAASAEEIVFTGSGTESIHLAVAGAANALRHRGDHLVTTTFEHPATLATCDELTERGFRVSRVPVGGDGLVDPADIEAAITDRTVLVTVIHAQNEIGTLQPVGEIGAITRRRGVWLHVDAAHSLPAVPVDVRALGIDLLTVVGHKMYAPKGTAALYVRDGVDLVPQLGGGGQERGLRAGTENVAGIVGLGHAAQLLVEQRDSDAARVLGLREQLRTRLAAELPDLRINGSLAHRIPGNLSLTIPDVPADELMAAMPDVAVSAGAACHSDSVDPSPTLTAIGLTPEEARCSLRVGIGRYTTRAEIDHAATSIIDAARTLRADRAAAARPHRPR